MRFTLSGGKKVETNAEKIPFVIFPDDKRYWNVFEPICREFDRRGVDVVHMTASPDDPALENTYEHIKGEFIGKNNKAFARMNFINAGIVLFITPGFLQIPFFISAYRFLSGLSLLNGASFGLITDMGRPDGMLQLAGASVNVQPVIMTAYYPLLMVKDFGDGEFETSEEFMTNGDVPTLATKDIIEQPMNPFTGKIIDNSEKTAHDQYVIFSTEYAVSKDSKNTTYLPAKWCAVQEDMRDMDNWKLLSEEETLFPPVENKD